MARTPHIPNVENEISKRSGEMHIYNQLDNIDWGKRRKIRVKKVTVKDTKTGEVFGSRTIATKESITFSQFLLREAKTTSNDDHTTMLPKSVIGEIQRNINIGAKDLSQKWKHALELVNKAYHVSSIRRPKISETGGWKQYTQLIQYAVKKLSEYRGVDGDWRMTKNLVSEQAEQPDKLPQTRIFVYVPGAAALEVDEQSIDQAIETLANKLRRKGYTLRVVTKAENVATCLVIKKYDSPDGVASEKQHEQIVIRKLS